MIIRQINIVITRKVSNIGAGREGGKGGRDGGERRGNGCIRFPTSFLNWATMNNKLWHWQHKQQLDRQAGRRYTYAYTFMYWITQWLSHAILMYTVRHMHVTQYYYTLGAIKMYICVHTYVYVCMWHNINTYSVLNVRHMCIRVYVCMFWVCHHKGKMQIVRNQQRSHHV